MLPRRFRLTVFLALLIPMLAACSVFRPDPTPTPVPSPAPSATPLPTAGATPLPGSQPVQITGEFEYSNDFVLETYFVEHMVALVDMRGFVLRNKDWLIPVESQTLGYMDLDANNKRGTFWLQLPAQPAGVYSDVDQDANAEAGVQVFSVAYWPNLAGGPYSDGEDPSRGWPTYLTSVKIDTENQDEITGGRLVVWSPDDRQQFPSGFGADGLLFSTDDPQADLPAGYSVIDLDQEPFGLIHDREPKLTLYEPGDIALKDFAGLSYTQAFRQMFAIARKEYAFNGASDKQPDWDDLYTRLEPKVSQAETDSDGYAFYVAVMEFVTAFKDGHVGMSSDRHDAKYFSERAAGGYGLTLRELDDGSAVVTFVLAGGPAEQAGIQVGDTITRFNDLPVGEAIGAVQPLSAPHSSSFALRYQQGRYLLRDRVGARARVIFEHNGQAQEATLAAIDERDSLVANSLYQGYDPDGMPVEYRILDSGLGYVRVNSNNDDLNLVNRLFLRALQIFERNQVTGVIIDMRRNLGGSPLGLAGYLTDQTVEMGQLEYFSDKTGRFQPDGPRDRLHPNEEQFRFRKLALLVDQTCFSACELEAYGFSRVPGMVVIGQYPTAGVEAEVARGQFVLPEGIHLQLPTGRFTLPDGSLFLEGTGVQPTRRVPVTRATVLTDEDVVLRAAEEALR